MYDDADIQEQMCLHLIKILDDKGNLGLCTLQPDPWSCYLWSRILMLSGSSPSSLTSISLSIRCSCSSTALFRGRILGLHSISAKPPLQKQLNVMVVRILCTSFNLRRQSRIMEISRWSVLDSKHSPKASFSPFWVNESRFWKNFCDWRPLWSHRGVSIGHVTFKEWKQRATNCLWLWGKNQISNEASIDVSLLDWRLEDLQWL